MSADVDDAIAISLLIAFVIWFASCGEPQPNYPEPVVYTSEQDCQDIVTRSRIRIDSFIMLRCQTKDTAVWRRYEDSIQAEMKSVFRQVDTSGGKFFKYINTKYTGKKIPCAIGDSVMIFYKLTPEG